MKTDVVMGPGADGSACRFLSMSLATNRKFPSARPARFGSRRQRQRLLIALGLLGLSLLTAWNLTRSDALGEARRAEARGDLALGLQRALDHLVRQPWSHEAALVAARCLSRLDYADEAEEYYRRASPLSLSDLQIRAYGLVRGPHPERAIPAYHEILERSPENVTAMRRLAAVLLARNDAKDLLGLADRLHQIPAGRVIGEMLRGVVYHNRKNPRQAVAAFEKVLELDPELGEMPASHGLFWNHFTADLAASGRLEDVRRHLTKLLENTPEAGLMNRLGETLFLQGDLDAAEHWFRQAAELDPASYAPHWNLAKLAIQRRHRGEALEHLNRARIRAPGQYAVLYNLASVYRQLGQSAEAEQVQEAIRQLRSRPVATPRPPNGQWPRYAL
jgi:tetratricopeptide (TPR) repeat protein